VSALLIFFAVAAAMLVSPAASGSGSRRVNTDAGHVRRASFDQRGSVTPGAGSAAVPTDAGRMPLGAQTRLASLKPGVEQPSGEYVRGELIVRFREDSPVLHPSAGRVMRPAPDGRSIMLPVIDETYGQFDVQVETFGGSEIVPGLRLGRVAPDRTLEAIRALKQRADVLYAEPNYIYHLDLTPNDPQFSHPNMYGLGKIGAPQAWDITQGSQSVVVGVVDGGIDTQHEDLKDNIWVNPGEVAGNGVDDDGDGFIDDVNGWDFVHNDKTVFDSPTEDDHGTHVAGTIGARGNNGVGVVGVNWQVSLMSIKVCGTRPVAGTGCFEDSLLAGYSFALKMKQRGINLRVLNNSYGGTGFAQANLDAIQALSNAGILFVAAAGNETTDNFSIPHYPSSYDLPNVIGVASTTSTDAISNFSNFGQRVVSIGAPGSNILSTTPRNYASQNTGITGANGSTYSIFSGTSMATPHVTGAAALVVAAKPNISMQELRGVLAYSGDPIAALADKTTTGRRLNVFKSIQSALENDTTPPATPTLQVVSQSGRSVSFSWTEPGDDGFSGTAADHDFIFTNSANGLRTFIPTLPFQLQSGTQQTASVNIPYLSFNGTLEMRVYDNAGNFSTASVPVSVSDNIFSDPYAVAEGASGSLSTGGTRLALDGDDKYARNITLPFPFPYFGQSLTQIAVSSNGAIYFTPPNPPSRDTLDDADDVPSAIADMRHERMLAVLWDDLEVDTGSRADAGVFQVTPNADSVIFRWQSTQFDAPTSPVNFEAELRRDGTIIYRYGSGNTNLYPVVGIGSGEPEPYVIASHTAEREEFSTAPRLSLTNAASVTFTPRTNASTVQFSADTYSVNENAGTATITVTRTGNTDTSQSVGYVTDNTGTATLGTDYNPTSGLLNFGPGETTKTFTIQIFDDAVVEPTETVLIRLLNPSSGTSLGTPSNATLSILDDDQIGPNSVQFSASSTSVAEGAGKFTVTVTRTGADVTHTASVFYQTANGTASERSDYTATLGTLQFAAGETSKSFDVLVTDDRFAEGTESFNVTLSQPVQTSLGTPVTLTVNLNDNDVANGPSPVRWDSNFETAFFVRQHYADFLNREPDTSGFQFWQNEINQCGSNVQCAEVKRINVSAAFFLSIEFQQTGYLVERTYKAAFGDATGTARDANNNPVSISVPVIRLNEFLPDTQRIGQGIIVGQGAWEQQLEANKQAFMLEFVQRQRFLNAFPLSLTAAQFVDQLNQNAGGVLSQGERDQLAGQLSGAGSTSPSARAVALRAVADNATLRQRELNRAFVLMQYFGYLRRNPNDAPDADYTGWKFWFDKLNQFGGNFVSAEMVKAFLTSTEYQQRFGQ
jgi:subtilisin family serine protease